MDFKENNADSSESADEINPISRLMQIQQAKKEKEPIYTVMEERGQTRRREFFMEVRFCMFTLVILQNNTYMAPFNALLHGIFKDGFHYASTSCILRLGARCCMW